MQKMRQELQYLQATLCARGATSSEEVQVYNFCWYSSKGL